MELYPWQKECVETWLKNGGHGIAKVVTGAGKTIMSLLAAKALRQEIGKPLKVRIVVPKVFLAMQWRETILRLQETLDVSPSSVGLWYGGLKNDPPRDWMVYVVDSARYALTRHLMDDFASGDAVLLILDECHHYASDENRHIFDFLSMKHGEYYTLGLSATPETFHYQDVTIPTIGPVIYTFGFSHALEEKVINPFSVFEIALPMPKDTQADYDELSDKISIIYGKFMSRYPFMGDMQEGAFFGKLQMLVKKEKGEGLATVLLGSIMKRRAILSQTPVRVQAGVALVKQLDSRDRILVYGEQIGQGEAFYEALAAEGFPCSHYHSKMSKEARRTNLERFRLGETRILVSCKALDEGLDVPDANVGIVLSSTSEERQRVQRLGRLLRRHQGKAPSSLYYLFIPGTIERSTMLADEVKGASVSLASYDGLGFRNDEYEEIAWEVFCSARERGENEQTLKMLSRCMEKGAVRPDCLLPLDLLEQNVEKPLDLEEHNYWVTMLLMARRIHA